MTIRELIAKRAPRVRDLHIDIDDLPLGAEGLGLDSIAIAEVLLDCERHFGVRLAADLLDGVPITARRIESRLEQLAAS